MKLRDHIYYLAGYVHINLILFALDTSGQLQLSPYRPASLLLDHIVSKICFATDAFISLVVVTQDSNQLEKYSCDSILTASQAAMKAGQMSVAVFSSPCPASSC